jgi:hypothetical protein
MKEWTGPIASAFALPKMRKYGFTMLLVRDDEFGKIFPQEEKAATVLMLDAERKVTSIIMAKSPEEIEAPRARGGAQRIDQSGFARLAAAGGVGEMDSLGC